MSADQNRTQMQFLVFQSPDHHIARFPSVSSVARVAFAKLSAPVLWAGTSPLPLLL